MMTDEFLQWMEDRYVYYAHWEKHARDNWFHDDWEHAFRNKLVFQMAIETYKKSKLEKEKQEHE